MESDIGENIIGTYDYIIVAVNGKWYDHERYYGGAPVFHTSKLPHDVDRKFIFTVPLFWYE